MGEESDPAVIAQFGLYPERKCRTTSTTKGRPDGGHLAPPRPELPVPGRRFAGHQRLCRAGRLRVLSRAASWPISTTRRSLPGVLGHEIGHVTARHSAKQQTNAILGQVGLMGAMIASPRLAQFGEQAMQGLQLLFLKFGRDDESQADELGVEYSSKIGYDASRDGRFLPDPGARAAAGRRAGHSRFPEHPPQPRRPLQHREPAGGPVETETRHPPEARP